jgi:hypothetical protein
MKDEVNDIEGMVGGLLPVAQRALRPAGLEA